MLKRSAVAVAGLLLAAAASPAFAHPHIFVDAEATVTFDENGRVAAIHNRWAFDEAYSAWAVQGLDVDSNGEVSRAELQELADENMMGLADYGYYTFAGEGAGTLPLSRGSNATIDYVDGKTILNFDLTLAQPYAIGQALEIAVSDPEYYVAITFADSSAVSLVNPPTNCSVRLQDGQPVPDALAEQLYALPADVTTLPPNLQQALRGAQGAIVVDCPGGSAPGETSAVAPTTDAAATALEAASALAESPAAEANPDLRPLGGPPPEPGLNLPRTGVLGWLADAQRDFYLAMTSVLGQLKQDWTAFWVLGGLSLLYGVVHAAGPGHGKVVISSYLIASEAQVRRGLLLSFVSAMLQSAVAIGFVLVAAGILGLTSLAMDGIAAWLGTLSYGLIAALGLWLIARKLFGWGHHHGDHRHDGSRGDMLALARRHLAPMAPPLPAGAPSHWLEQPRDAHGRTADDPHFGHAHAGHHHHHEHDDSHGHAHVVAPQAAEGTWKEQLGVVLAVGLRPCSGALVILAFALSQGIVLAGIVGVVLMGLGTALTTGALAAAAVFAKRWARQLAGIDNPLTQSILWWVELAAAAAVFILGALLTLASLQA